jgi:hypothetical protein
MRILCVGRHGVLSEHLASLFQGFGAETCAAVGLDEAVVVGRAFEPQAVICDYDLLASVSLSTWEQDPVLSRVPVVAVSLTRRPEEAHVLDVNSVSGFVYLPALERADGERLLAAIERAVSAPPAQRPQSERPQGDRPQSDRPQSGHPPPPRRRRDTPESVSAC